MTSKPGPGELLLPTDYGTEILRSEVGSTLHGTGLGVGLEDHDEMGIFVEQPRSTIGLRRLEQYETRTAVRTAVRGDTPKGQSPKSQPGDTDLVIYSLRKWARLASGGNPSVLLLLFAPENKIVKSSELGADLRTRAKWFASNKAGRAFLGYMEKQRQRMVGQRGKAGRVRVLGECQSCQGGEVPYREWGVDGKIIECPHCRGTGLAVDWKYAMHMLRLGYQGVEYLTTGRLTLPIPDDPGDWLREVRQGHEDFGLVIKVAESLEEQVKRLLDGDSILPDEPEHDRIEHWVMQAHLKTWEKRGLNKLT